VVVVVVVVVVVMVVAAKVVVAKCQLVPSKSFGLNSLGVNLCMLLCAGKSPKDVSLFLVEKGMGGFRLGQKIEDKCGMRASMTAELVFDDVKVIACRCWWWW